MDDQFPLWSELAPISDVRGLGAAKTGDFIFQMTGPPPTETKTSANHGTESEVHVTGLRQQSSKALAAGIPSGSSNSHLGPKKAATDTEGVVFSFTSSIGADPSDPDLKAPAKSGDVERAVIGTVSSGEFPCEPVNFKENPQLLICDDARNALEAIMLKQMCINYGYFLEFSRHADTKFDFSHKWHYINFALQMSDHNRKLFDSIQKGRRTGYQEVVVKHQEVKRASTRRPRPSHADLGRSSHEATAKAERA